MANNQHNSYIFSYTFEDIEKNYGNDNYDIGTATMNVNLSRNEAEDGYDVTFDVPEEYKIDPAQGNGDAHSFYEYDVYPRLMSDLGGLGIGPEDLVFAGI